MQSTRRVQSAQWVKKSLFILIGLIIFITSCGMEVIGGFDEKEAAADINNEPLFAVSGYADNHGWTSSGWGDAQGTLSYSNDWNIQGNTSLKLDVAFTGNDNWCAFISEYFNGISPQKIKLDVHLPGSENSAGNAAILKIEGIDNYNATRILWHNTLYASPGGLVTTITINNSYTIKQLRFVIEKYANNTYETLYIDNIQMDFGSGYTLWDACETTSYVPEDHEWKAAGWGNAEGTLSYSSSWKSQGNTSLCLDVAFTGSDSWYAFISKYFNEIRPVSIKLDAYLPALGYPSGAGNAAILKIEGVDNNYNTHVLSRRTLYASPGGSITNITINNICITIKQIRFVIEKYANGIYETVFIDNIQMDTGSGYFLWDPCEGDTPEDNNWHAAGWGDAQGYLSYVNYPCFIQGRRSMKLGVTFTGNDNWYAFNTKYFNTIRPNKIKLNVCLSTAGDSYPYASSRYTRLKIECVDSNYVTHILCYKILDRYSYDSNITIYNTNNYSIRQMRFVIEKDGANQYSSIYIDNIQLDTGDGYFLWDPCE